MNTFSKVQNSVVFLYTNNENAEKEIRKIIPYIKSQKKKTYGQGMVAHIYNPSYLGGRERRITVQGQPRQKVSEIYLQIKQGMMTHSYGLNYSGGRGRRITVGGWPKQKHEALPKKKN
jgi:hypothetical protein